MVSGDTSVEVRYYATSFRVIRISLRRNTLRNNYRVGMSRAYLDSDVIYLSLTYYINMSRRGQYIALRLVKFCTCRARCKPTNTSANGYPYSEGSLYDPPP